jgi:hypothetical protein
MRFINSVAYARKRKTILVNSWRREESLGIEKKTRVSLPRKGLTMSLSHSLCLFRKFLWESLLTQTPLIYFFESVTLRIADSRSRVSFNTSIVMSETPQKRGLLSTRSSSSNLNEGHQLPLLSFPDFTLHLLPLLNNVLFSFEYSRRSLFFMIKMRERMNSWFRDGNLIPNLKMHTSLLCFHDLRRKVVTRKEGKNLWLKKESHRLTQ